jgi:CBS domain containing-hemolysin-like protein
MSVLGRLPVVGDTVPVTGGDLKVERLDGRRIDRLRFTPGPEDEASVTADARERSDHE